MLNDVKCLRDSIVLIISIPVEKKGAIIMPENHKERTDWCKVYRTGPDVKAVEVGDLVLMPDVSTMRGSCDFHLPNGDECIVVNEEDIRVVRA